MRSSKRSFGPDGSELVLSGELHNFDPADLDAYDGLRVAVHDGTAAGRSRGDGSSGFVEKIIERQSIF